MQLVPLPMQKGIEPGFKELLLEIDRAGSVICGGYARYLASPYDTVAEDIDLYPTSKQAYEASLHLLDKAAIKSSRRMAEYNGVKDIHTFQVKTHWKDQEVYQIQLINAIGSPERIIKHFDFTVVQAYVDWHHHRVMTTSDFAEDERHKVLRFNKVAYKTPALAVWRVMKYLSKNYTLTDESLLQIYTFFKTGALRQQFIEDLTYQVKDRLGLEFEEKWPRFQQMRELYQLEMPEPQNVQVDFLDFANFS
jgi:hypothetical protein